MHCTNQPITLNKVDIILGTESHLDDPIKNSEIFPGHYQIYHKNRNIHGGGVFILNDNIPSNQVIIIIIIIIIILLYSVQH